MGGERRVFIYWDGDLDGPFRRRLERALGELQVDYADASQVDHDPDGEAPVKLAVVSPTGQSAPADADIVLLGGPGEFHVRSALRLLSEDIERRTRPWVVFADRLGAKLGRPALGKFAADASVEEQRALSLAFPADPLSKDFAPNHSPDVLMEKLADAEARAQAAERAVATAQLNESNAVRAAKTADAQAAAERARIAELEREVERLAALNEATAFALSSVAADMREVVETARDHAWRARLVAARAAEMAAQHPDALTWKGGVTYSGETVNKRPHGLGVMVFRDGARETARYAGAFEDGRRSGHGAGTSSEGETWTGEWRNNEACGHGLLEAADGRRFEGQLEPDLQNGGAPKQVKERGWIWDPAVASARRPEAHRPLAPALPAPH